MSRLKFLKKWLTYLPINLSIRNLVDWKPLDSPQAGYTAVIGCMNNMVEITLANVSMIAKMNLTNLHELILVFDVREDKFKHRQHILQAAGNIPVRFIFYDRQQEFIAGLISWGWVYSWLSWTKAIATSKTQYVLLHDLDAICIDPNMFEYLYQEMIQSDCMFLGARRCKNEYFSEEDNLIRTFEMILDAQRLRRDFLPFDAFTKVKLVKGKCVVYDTFFYIQSLVRSSQLRFIDQEQLVHPSELISQYTDLLRGRVTAGFWGLQANLPLLPIYFFFGGNPTLLNTIVNHLEQTNNSRLPFMGKSIDFTGVPSKHWDWLWLQTRLLENAYFGASDPDIERYISLMDRAYNPNSLSQLGSS